MTNNLWEAVYYPREIIDNQRTKTIFCLLFDKIYCLFPVNPAGPPCGSGCGISEEIKETLDSTILIDEGIIEFCEEQVLWVADEFYDKDLHLWFNLQVTALALEKCSNESVVPITDNKKFQIPASIIDEIHKLTESPELHIHRNAKMQAIALALSSIEMVLPPLDALKDEEIMIAREKLSEELIPFRRSMLKLSPLLRSMINENATVQDIYAEARYMNETSIMPALSELRERIEKEKGVFWRKLLMRSGKILPKFIANWSQKNLISAAIDSLGDLTEIGISSIDRQSFVDNLKRDGGLGFLLSLEEQVRNK